MLNNFSTDPVFTPEQVLENRGRVAIFIDGSNLFYAALLLGIEIDYTKLLVRLTAGSR
ncbi:MAG: NYN domain-containing protein, partial [Tolypothrix sp. T3-bin4]|nr:NYN domain-containing protein [Tolypothrix sp. T3-bin4]